MKKEHCCGCAACTDACPTGALRMAGDREGFRYPALRQDLCIHCGRCEAVCPLAHESAGNPAPSWFGARVKTEAVRLGSSSGGLFPLLADYVLRRGGAVFGAAFDEQMDVVHREARTAEELEGLKRTKYVQSRPDGVYRRIQALLNEGVWVLFCGTPCQAHGLKLFLGRDDPRLILVDLVCYGVPSPGLWRDYLRVLERRRGGPVTAFSFRDKRNRDHGHTRAYTAGGREYAEPLNQDLFCGMYFTNLCIRPSCHVCPYGTADRESDFTLGDFWGVERVRPEAGDGMGVSLAALRTEKARQIWEEVREELDWFPCEKEDARQPRLEGPTPPSRFRGAFMALRRVLPGPALFFLFEKTRAAAGVCRWLVRRVLGR